MSSCVFCLLAMIVCLLFSNDCSVFSAISNPKLLLLLHCEPLLLLLLLLLELCHRIMDGGVGARVVEGKASRI